MKRILVTGSNGMLGRELRKVLKTNNQHEVFNVTRKDYDLLCEDEVNKMYDDIKPCHVIHLAAKVGGIVHNVMYPVEFLEQNILINTLVTKYAYKHNVEKFTGLISACSYPSKVDKYPIQEESLFDGIPESTNLCYAYAKRVQALHIRSYRDKYDKRWNYIIPSNLYGEDDKPIDMLHFIPALIQKILNAQKNNEKSITLLGDGTPRRQFVYVRDIAKIIVEMIERNITDDFNVTCPWNLTISQMANIVMKTMNVNLDIVWDFTKPNGQHRRDLCSRKFNDLFPDFQFTDLESGVKQILDKSER